MSTPATALVLDDWFARELPEMAVAWKAADAPDPRLLVLNEPLAADLGLALALDVQAQVREAFGVELHPEPVWVGL